MNDKKEKPVPMQAYLEPAVHEALMMYAEDSKRAMTRIVNALIKWFLEANPRLREAIVTETVKERDILLAELVAMMNLGGKSEAGTDFIAAKTKIEFLLAEMNDMFKGTLTFSAEAAENPPSSRKKKGL